MASSNSMKVQVEMDASGLIDGAKQATGAIKEVSQEVSQADSSFKSIRSEINKQQSEVNKLANAYMQMRDKYGETSAAALDYKAKLDTSVQSLAKLKAENEGVQNAIKQATQAILNEGNAVQQSAQQIQSVSQRFEEIKNSGEPMKQQLRELKGLLAEMNFNGQGMSEEFNEVAQYAGKLKDAIQDANTATNVFANDTANLQAVIQSVQLVTAGFSALKGTMSMLGIENKNFEATMKKIQGAMLTLNALQQIANLLNKNSILIQRLQVTWYKVKDAVLKTQTMSLKANTVAEAVNTAGTKLSTIAQNAWNIAKAVAKALLGDFTGLLIVGIGALATYAMATSDSTEEIEKQTDALANNTNGIDDNTDAVDKNKKAQEEWAKDVASSCAEQISTYRMLQQKWNECNGDVKLQGKFMRDYKSEIDSLGLGIYNLLDAEKAFVSYTDSVVAAIYARARAEAYKNQITKSAEREIELMMQNEKDMTYTWKPAKDKEVMWAEEANKIGIGQGDYSYHNIHTGEYTWTEQGKAKINAYRKNQGYEQWRKRHNDRVAEIYGERENQAALRRLQQREVDIVNRELAKAGLSAKDYSSATGGGAKSVYGNYGRHSGSGGRGHSSRGGSGSSGSGDRGPSDQEVLRALEEKILDMKQNLTLDLVPEGEIDAYIAELAKFTQKYDELAEKLGAPLYGSLDWKKKELADLQRNMTSGYIDEKDLDNARDKVELLKKDIEEDEITLGIKTKPLEGTLDWFEKEIHERQEKLRKGLIPEEEIEKTKKEIEDLTKKEYELKIKLGFEEAPKTDFEKNTVAGKYVNDWQNLEKFVGDYNKRWDEYQQNLKQYEQDMNAYDAAQKKYTEDLKQYNEQQKRYEELRKKNQKLDEYVAKLDKQLEDDIIDQDRYNQLYDEYRTKLFGVAEASEKAADKTKELTSAIAGVESGGTLGEAIELDEVVTQALFKPKKPELPQLQLPKKPFAPGQEIDLKEIFGDSYDGLPAHIQQLMTMVGKRMEESLSDGERALGSQIIIALQKDLEEKTQGKSLFKVPVEPEFKLEGTDWYKRSEMTRAQAEFNQIVSDYNIGLIKSSDDAIKKLEEVNQKLISLGLKPIEIEIKANWQKQLDLAADGLKQMGDLMSSIGKETDNMALNVAGTIAQAIANIWLGYSQASAQSASMGPWAWVGFSLGALAQTLGVISAIKANKYAGGGIVDGSSRVGDQLYARLNGGEMVMNNRQQQHLWNIINGSRSVDNSGMGGTVVFEVKGDRLYGVLNNYNKKKQLVGKNIGIK